MKIAILTPHPVPLVLGGLENLKWGLQDAIHRLTDHRCDVIGQFSPENDFWDVVGSYREASRLDLSNYDLVISGKYPMWMVDHPNHVLYMLHKLRGLYDTYPGGDTAALHNIEPVTQALSWMADKSAAGRLRPRQENDELFDRLDRLKQLDISPAAFAYPGPLARAVVHFLDTGAISTRTIQRFAAQSETVRKRAGYLPLDADTRILYPPPHRDDYFCAGQDYFFTSSRLDRPKRLDILIEAMKLSRTRTPLLIAGTGPDEARLKELAGDDSRIQFLGFVPDERMAEMYANALAVPFIPHEEDYGLVTVEAMRSAKPVVTFVDSGGPTELIRSGRNGYVLPTSAAALAERLDHLANNRAEAREMGLQGRNDAEAISWEALIEGLVANRPRRGTSRRRKRLTVATTFPIFPPVGGGQSRIYHLYSALAQDFDVEIVSLASGGPQLTERHVADGLKETRIAKSAQQEGAERDYVAALDGRPVSDIAAIDLYGLTPDFVEALQRAALESDALIASHPFLFGALQQAAPTKPIWYEAHNVELTLKEAVLSGVEQQASALERVRKIERQAWKQAQLVFACTNRDLAEFTEIYGPTRARQLEVPNGVKLSEFRFVALAERRQLQKSANWRSAQVALFLGSWHGPNLEAVEHILSNAENLPDALFLIAGSCCTPFKKRRLPANVKLLGTVSNEDRAALLASVDVALNPMFTGSGTNLKMLDYFASGVPVVSTEFGARGLSFDAGDHFELCADDGIADALLRLRHMGDEALATRVQAARDVAANHYDWRKIARRFIVELDELDLI